MIITSTTIYNETLRALDNGKSIYLLGNEGGYSLVTTFAISSLNQIMLYVYGFTSVAITPENGATNLYTSTKFSTVDDDFISEMSGGGAS